MCVCVCVCWGGGGGGGGGGGYIDVMRVDLASTLCCYLGSFFTKPVSIYNEQKVVLLAVLEVVTTTYDHNTTYMHAKKVDISIAALPIQFGQFLSYI